MKKSCSQLFSHAGALALLGLASVSLPAQAAVSAFSAHSLQIKHEVMIDATPEQVYQSLMEKVGQWWNPAHTYTRDGKNLSIENKVGGCFCEKFPEGGGIEHLRLVYIQPNKVLRFQGALGPFQASGVAGSLTWTMAQEKSTDANAKPQTKLQLVYSFGGFMDGSFERIAPAADGMLGDQIGRLKRFIETGKPDTK